MTNQHDQIRRQRNFYCSQKGMFRLDLIIAMFAVCAGLTAALASYQAMLAKERPATPLDSIPYGEHRYFALHHGKCIGEVGTSLTYDGEYILETDVNLRFAFQGRKGSATLKLEASFNSLGQLGGLLVRIEGFESNLLVGTTGVNPFRLVVRGDLAGQKIAYQQHLPGPVELLRAGRDHYRLQYRYFPAFQFSEEDISRQPLYHYLSIDFRDVKEMEQCQGDQEGYLQLDPVVNLLSGLFRLYGNDLSVNSE